VASRAEAVLGPATEAASSPTRAPSLAGAVRGSLSDLYYHSWRLVPANVVWAAVAIALLFVIVIAPAGLLLMPVLAVPTAGLFRMTTRIARADAVSFWDSAAAWREGVVATLLLGAGLSIAAVVLTVNLVTGILTGTLLGWAFATLAFWGLVAVWLFAWTVWPVLADPARERWPARDRVHLAALVVLAFPLRIAALGAGLLVLVVASTVAFVAILTVSVAIAALIAARYVLPAADRLDAQLRFSESRGLRGPEDDEEIDSGD
jgi:hypothetical protein